FTRTGRQNSLLRSLSNRQRSHGPLPHRLLVPIVEVRVLLLDDLAHAHNRELFWYQIRIEQSALCRGLVLQEGSDDLVEVLFDDALGRVAGRFYQPLDLDLHLPRLVVESDVGGVRVVTTLTVVEPS